ncbi:MAG: pantoate--beta-alanine ligase [Dehalococcoidia bacterium]|nr:pantoate--beta-alanine ligase [Dehalococcoidia bacterium]
MEIVKTIGDMKALRRQMRGQVGFVPTMGYLHEGHLVLVRNSRKGNDHTVASIFVNPTQFGPKEDFTAYPRDPERDFAMLEREGVDAVFIPGAGEMYPPGFDTWVEAGKITERLEGAVRPGHFRGVATVCTKLFNIVEPDRAYFGQKDAQQVTVIIKVVRDLDMNLEIVVVPTVREADGLAMSSRNVYLNPMERKAAVILWKVLSTADKLWAGGESNADRIRGEMVATINKEPLAHIDYVSVADTETLEELEVINRAALVSLAVKFGRTRLIDNIVLKK